MNEQLKGQSSINIMPYGDNVILETAHDISSRILISPNTQIQTTPKYHKVVAFGGLCREVKLGDIVYLHPTCAEMQIFVDENKRSFEALKEIYKEVKPNDNETLNANKGIVEAIEYTSVKEFNIIGYKITE